MRFISNVQPRVADYNSRMSDPAMNPPPPPPPAQPETIPPALLSHLDAQSRLTTGFLCGSCSYNLVGLVYTAACPECGTPLLKSLAQRTLALADPRWLRTVGRGLHWFCVAIVVWVVLRLGGGAIGTVSRLGTPTWAGLVALLSIVPSLILLYAVWNMTLPEPALQGAPATAHHKDRRDDIWRQVARLVLVLAGVISVVPELILGVLLLAEGASFNQWGALPMSLLAGSGCLPPMLMLGGLMALVRYLTGLAERIPGSNLPRLLMALLVILPTSALLGPGLLAVGFIVGFAGGPNFWAGAIVAVGGLLTLGFLLAMVMLVSLPWRLGNQFRAMADRL